MRKLCYFQAGSADVLQVVDAPRPGVGPGEVLVAVSAAALNPKDVLVRKGRFEWLTRGKFPRGCGYDFSGKVVSSRSSSWTEGAPVYGMINGMVGRTAADFVCVSEDELAAKPASLGFLDAAALPLVSLTALQALRDDAGLSAGETVVIHGASGGVGTVAIQIARSLGAEVIGVCSSRNRALVSGLGAHHVLCYDEVDITAELREMDVFFDVFGSRTFSEVRPMLARRGRFVSTVPDSRIAIGKARSLFSRRSAHLVIVKSRRRDLETLNDMVSSGDLRPVVDRVFGLDEAGRAHRYLETRRARGKVVLDLSLPAS